MKKCQFALAVLFISITLAACAPLGPTTPIEILETLETMANEKDLEGTMALFAKDAVVEESFRNDVFDGTEEIERLWKGYYDYLTVPSEFRDISVDGDTATFRWAEVYTLNTNLWPVIIEVQNGKITYMDFYENLTTVPTGEE
jgi:hypothetical protein